MPTGLFEARHAPALAVDGTVEATFLVDGGVLNNLPARNAVEAIEAQPAGEQVHRVLALVVPDPVVQASREGAEPLMAQTIGQAAVTIPRNQSLSAFLVEVRDHNNDVLSRRSARAAFLGELGELEPAPAWDRFVAVSDALFPSYRAARHRRSCDRILARLADKLDPELARVLVDVAGDAESVTLPVGPRGAGRAPGGLLGRLAGTTARRPGAQLDQPRRDRPARGGGRRGGGAAARPQAPPDRDPGGGGPLRADRRHRRAAARGDGPARRRAGRGPGTRRCAGGRSTPTPRSCPAWSGASAVTWATSSRWSGRTSRPRRPTPPAPCPDW